MTIHYVYFWISNFPPPLKFRKLWSFLGTWFYHWNPTHAISGGYHECLTGLRPQGDLQMMISASNRVLLSRRCVSGSEPDFIIETQPTPSVEATMSVWLASDHGATSKWRFRPLTGCYSVEGMFRVPHLILSLKPNPHHQWRLTWVFDRPSTTRQPPNDYFGL